MGGKQNRCRQHIFLFPAACLIYFILMTGCRTASGPLAGGPSPRTDQLEAQLLDQAEACLKSKDYAGTLKRVDQAICCCSGRYSKRALHILEATLAAPNNPVDAHHRAIRCFKSLDSSSSDSMTGPAARCWAAALNEVIANEAEIQELKMTIQKLKRQIEQLKAVDLESQTPKSDGNVQ